jgi:HK97 family phage portal protein
VRSLVARPAPLAERLKAVLRRSFGLTDAKAWQMSFASGNAAGKSVTVDTALQLATVWACIRLISETVATLPLIVYRRGEDGSRTVAQDLPLYSLLHDSPHADFTAVEFWEGVAASLCLWGNAYAEKIMRGGRLSSLQPLRCELMVVDRNDAGERVYRYHDPDGFRVLREDRVFHVRGFGHAGDVGLSPIAYARQSLGSAMAAEESAARLFAGGIQPGGILTSPGTLTPEQRTQLQSIMQQFVGSSNANKMMIMEAGLSFSQVTMNQDDVQMLETRSFAVEEICRWFRVPPFMVGHTQKTTSWGTGLEQQQIGFLTFALRPYLSRIEQAVRRSLIPAAERSRVFAEFKVEGLLRGDSKARAAFYAIMVQNGIMTRNEVRGLENLPPKPGGDKLTVQSQNVPLGEQPAIDEEPADVDDQDEDA